MSTRYCELASALRDAIQAELSPPDNIAVEVERRMQPRMNRTEFAPATVYVSVFVGAGSWEIIARQVDRQEWEIVLGIQSALPDPTPPEGNPFGPVNSPTADPVAWADDVFELVERIKDLFRAETDEWAAGVLRDRELAGCTFYALEHEPVYVPAHLSELGILTSVLTLTYRITDPEDED